MTPITPLSEQLRRELDLLNSLRPLADTVDATDDWHRLWNGQRMLVRVLMRKYADQQGFKLPNDE